jgi:hypothetical protein
VLKVPAENADSFADERDPARQARHLERRAREAAPCPWGSPFFEET